MGRSRCVRVRPRDRVGELGGEAATPKSQWRSPQAEKRGAATPIKWSGYALLGVEGGTWPSPFAALSRDASKEGPASAWRARAVYDPIEAEQAAWRYCSWPVQQCAAVANGGPRVGLTRLLTPCELPSSGSSACRIEITMIARPCDTWQGRREG